MKSIRVVLVVLSVLAAQSYAGDVPDAGTKLAYRGFTIDTTALVNNKLPDHDLVVQAYKRQIEMVADLSVRAEVMEYFKKVPILIEATNSTEPGRSDGKTVFLQARQLAPDRVILLHELLHAYHNQVLKGGERNPTVILAHNLAPESYPFNRQEYYLTNEREFFAVTASIYLYGNILRAPYNRQTIQEAQPAYYRFLASEFAPPAPAAKSPAAKAKRKTR